MELEAREEVSPASHENIFFCIFLFPSLVAKEICVLQLPHEILLLLERFLHFPAGLKDFLQERQEVFLIVVVITVVNGGLKIGIQINTE